MIILFHGRLSARVKLGEHVIAKYPKTIQADIEGLALPSRMETWLHRLPDEVTAIIDTLAEHGHGAWLVGGCVRDAWLEIPGDDVDLCTSCPPDRMLSIFGDNAIPTGVPFGTVSVKGSNSVYEVTTLRTESLYNDGRRPSQVAWGVSLKDDLQRRDFTMNSMAVDVKLRQLYDPHDGVKDLEHRTIRAVGRPTERCREDALRILRAYRFWGVENPTSWTIETNLHHALVLLRSSLDNIAVERKWAELKKILAGPRPGVVLRQMQDDGVLHHVIKGLRTVPEHQLRWLDMPPERPWLIHHQLAILMHHHEPEDLSPVLRGLTVPKTTLQSTAVFSSRTRAVPETSHGDLRLYAHCLGEDAHAHVQVCSLGIEDGLYGQGTVAVESFLEGWQRWKPSTATVPPIVDGRWLMQRSGLGSGVRLGRLLAWLHRLQIERNITNLVDIETLLSTLPFVHGDPESWPTVSFPSSAGTIFMTEPVIG